MKNKRYLSILILIVLLINLFMPVANAVVETTDKTLADGIYKIRVGVSSNKYLGINKGSKELGADLQIWEKSDDQQQFKITRLENGYYKIIVVNSNYVLGIYNDEETNEIRVKQYKDTEEDTQQWMIKQTNEGYNIISKYNDLYMGICDGNYDNGTNVQILPESEGLMQVFSFEEVKEETKQNQEIKPSQEMQQNQAIESSQEMQQNQAIKPNADTQTEQDTEITMNTKAQYGAKPIYDLKEGTYKIKANVGSNMYLDIDKGSLEPEANLQIWEKSDVQQQQFRVTHLDDGYYKIVAVHSNCSLDVHNAGKINGTNVKQYTDTGGDAQEWKIEQVNGGYSIISKCNGLYVDINGGCSANGTNVQMYQGNGSDAQIFEFEEIGEITEQNPNSSESPKPDLSCDLKDGTYKIKAGVGGNMYLDIDGGKTTDNANLQIWSASDVAQQKFEVTYLGNGYYKIVASHSKKVLDVNNGGQTNGTNVKQYQDYGSDAQQWKLKKDGEYYTLVSKCNNLNLDIAGGAANNGTNVQMYAGNGSVAQKFKFEKVDATTPVEPPKEPQEEPKVPTEPEQKPANLPDGSYQIKSKLNGGRVIDIVDGKENDGQNVQIWDNYDVKQQKYHIKNVGDGYYSIRAVHSKKALDVTGGAKENNTNVQQYTYNGTDAQLWKIVINTDGSYSFISKCNGLYLDVQDAKGNNGDNIQVYQRNDAQDAQKFDITPTTYQEIDNGIYEIQMAKNANKVLDIDGGSTADGAKVQIWDRSQVNQQKFEVIYNNDKTYTIKAVHSGKVLEVPDGKPELSKQIQQNQSNNTDEQKWKIKDLGDGNYNIISKCGEMYLDVAGAGTNNGTHVQLYTSNESEAQLFQFEKTQKIMTGIQNYNTLDESRYPGFKSALQNVKNQHPNWNLNVYYTGITWDQALNEQEVGLRSLTQSTGAWRKNNTGYDVSGNWYLATRAAIAYMMDPRNSFDGYIFQFQDLASSSGTYNDIQKMVSGYSYLNNSNCINAILQAAQQNGISPFHIASRIMQECGKSGGSMYGYDYNGRKVYNLYNINVSGNGPEGLEAGAKYAYDREWYTPEASIIGGASFLKNNYIAVGQSTLYFQKYNVINKDYNHQYMQNIRVANDEGYTMYKNYNANGLLESSFTFVIPVYENMPAFPCPRPST